MSSIASVAVQKNAALTTEVAEAFGLTTMTSRKWHVQASIATRCASTSSVPPVFTSTVHCMIHTTNR